MIKNLREKRFAVKDENGKYVSKTAIKYLGDGQYIYTAYDEIQESYNEFQISYVISELVSLNQKAKLNHTFSIVDCDFSEEDTFYNQFEILNNFKTDKVNIEVNGVCVVTKTYSKFTWDTDADYLILADEDSSDLVSITFDDILEVVEENDDLIKIELNSGFITIMLDDEYSRCNECHTERPTHVIHCIGEESEEGDIRICNDCLDKLLFGKK